MTFKLRSKLADALLLAALSMGLTLVLMPSAAFGEDVQAIDEAVVASDEDALSTEGDATGPAFQEVMSNEGDDTSGLPAATNSSSHEGEDEVSATLGDAESLTEDEEQAVDLAESEGEEAISQGQGENGQAVDSAEALVSDDDANSQQETLADGQEAVSKDTQLLEQAGSSTARQGRWVVSDAYGQGLQRYWIWSDTNQRARGELITPDNGAGYYAWATDQGYVLRGKWDNGRGRVYVADNDGRLVGSDLPTDEDGWVVSKVYDGGWQRYYVDAETRAACSGFFTVDGYGDCFGLGGDGYVIRGDFSFGNRFWSADNDGKLRSGWYVTSGFGQGLQRYWMGDVVYASPHAAAKNRLIDAQTDGSGYYAWATSDCTILRGKLSVGSKIYLANNDGKLESGGWLVTAAYDGGLQRYYVDPDAHAVVAGFFQAPWGSGTSWFYNLAKTGYVMRGKHVTSAGVLLADNEGLLIENSRPVGWTISGTYDNGALQRYFIMQNGGHLFAKTGYFRVDAKSYYGNPTAGYIVRNASMTYCGSRCTSDNEGVLRYANGSNVSVANSWSGPRILMLGNSFTYYNGNQLSTTLTGLLSAEVVTSTKSGAALSDHLNTSTEIGVQSMKLLSSGNWDYVVLQEQSTKSIDNYSGYLSALTSLINKAAAKGATPVIYGTWAFNGTGSETSTMGALARGISLVTMQGQLNAAFENAAATSVAVSSGALLADVGSAFQDQSFSSSLYSSDAKHPSLAGSRLAAKVIANTISSGVSAA